MVARFPTFWSRLVLFALLLCGGMIYHHALSSSSLAITPNQTSFLSLLQELSWQGWVTILILVFTLYGLVTELRPPDIVMLISACLLTAIGILSPTQLLRGFSSEIVMTIGTLFIIVRALEVNGVLDLASKKMLPSASAPKRALASLLAPVAALSAFLNNTVIVLMMTPVVRKWTLEHGISPSKFLIPLSYASIVGGLCTLIGTSTNIIVNSLLEEHGAGFGFSFFELSLIGIPCTIIAITYIVLIGYHLLPVRQDVATALSEQTREFTGEFIVGPDCPLSNKLVKEISGTYFYGEQLAEIERPHRTITAPGPYDVILEGDRLIFAGDINRMAELHTIKGLQSAADPHFKLDETSSHFSEVVISQNSSLIGTTIKNARFRRRFGASVFAVYRQGMRVEQEVPDVVLEPGDTLILLTSEPWDGKRFSRDFYSLRLSEKLTIFKPWRAMMIGLSLIAMVASVMMGVPIVKSVLVTALFFLFTRCINAREAQKSIMWNVLLLIASSFAVATAVETTGVAKVFAKILLGLVGSEQHMLIGGILLVTSMFTEMLSNNAAALLLFPVAWQTATLAGYDTPEAMKGVGVAVAVGASCGFALPTGYQTHLIVYGPGGYRFRDFFFIGILLDILIIVTSVILIPYFWPIPT